MESIIYVFSVLLSVFVLSGINYTNFFKKESVWEARAFIIVISLALGYLLGSFIITFMEVARIF